VCAVPDQAASRLETALFVRQLREAGHIEVAAAKHEFFNADLLVRDIVDKGVPEELDALAECDAIVLAIWESRFNEYVHRQPADPLLTGLYPAVMRDVRESVHAFPARLPITVVHRCGMLHRLVEQRRAGWVRHWREVAAEHHGPTTTGEASP
jgi:hypothetical protein